MKIHYVAVLVAAVAAFIVGGIWYSPLLFGRAYLTLRGLDPNAASGAAMPAAEIAGEFARCLVLASVLAAFVAMLRIGSLTAALGLGALVWLAVYTTLAGSVLHDGTPWRLYAIHAGDGLVKIAVMTAILGLWRAR